MHVLRAGQRSAPLLNCGVSRTNRHAGSSLSLVTVKCPPVEASGFARSHVWPVSFPRAQSNRFAASFAARSSPTAAPYLELEDETWAPRQPDYGTVPRSVRPLMG